MKQDKKRGNKLDTLFATFCACAVDYIVHWSYLPPTAPCCADDYNEPVEHLHIDSELFDEMSVAEEQEVEQKDVESNGIHKETKFSFEVDVINDYISVCLFYQH